MKIDTKINETQAKLLFPFVFIFLISFYFFYIAQFLIVSYIILEITYKNY